MWYIDRSVKSGIILRNLRFYRFGLDQESEPLRTFLAHAYLRQLVAATVDLRSSERRHWCHALKITHRNTVIRFHGRSCKPSLDHV